MKANSMFIASDQLPFKFIEQTNHIVGGVPIKTNLQRAINHGYEPSGSIDNHPRAIHILPHVISAIRHCIHLKNKNPTAHSLSVPAMGRTGE